MHNAISRKGFLGRYLNVAAGLAFLSLLIVFTSSSTPGQTNYAPQFDAYKRVSKRYRTTYQQIVAPVFPGSTMGKYGSLSATVTSDMRQLRTGLTKAGYSGRMVVQNEGSVVYAGGSRTLFLIAIRPAGDGPNNTEPSTVAGKRSLTGITEIVMLFKTTGKPALLDYVEAEPTDTLSMLYPTKVSGYIWQQSYHQMGESESKKYSLLSTKDDRLSMVYDGLPQLYSNVTCENDIAQQPILKLDKSRGKRSEILRIEVMSWVSTLSPKCTDKVKRLVTKKFIYTLRKGTDGKFVVVTDPGKSIRRENVRLGLENDKVVK